MGDARIVSRTNTLLIGMSFYGDPSGHAAAGGHASPIAALWKRFNDFLEEDPHAHGELAKPGSPGYEVHVASPEMAETGRYEVFVGKEVTGRSAIPIRCTAKVLPAADYAVLTVRGAAIAEDWMTRLYTEIIPGLGREADESFGFELHDGRYLGPDRLAESVIEYYVPLMTPETR